MKKVLCVLVLLAAFVSSAFSENITGFMGISFDSSKDVAMEEMKSRNWGAVMEYDDKVLFYNDRGSYFGCRAEKVELYFNNDRLAGGKIWFNADSAAKQDIKMAMNVINQLFEVRLTNSSKTDCSHNWHFESANSNFVEYTDYDSDLFVVQVGKKSGIGGPLAISLK